MVLQLLMIVDECTEIVDRNGVISVLYWDFQKAFDTVPHNRLLDLLSQYGINDPILTWVRDFLSWVRDFLTDREQQVVVNVCKPNILDLISGVPQGSVFRPLLHNLHEFNGGEIFLYADDLQNRDEIESVEAEILQDMTDCIIAPVILASDFTQTSAWQ